MRRGSKRSLAWLLALTPGLTLLPTLTAAAAPGDVVQGEVVHVATESDLNGLTPTSDALFGSAEDANSTTSLATSVGVDAAATGATAAVDGGPEHAHGPVETFIRTGNEFSAVTDPRVTALPAGAEVTLRVADADAETLQVLSVQQVRVADSATGLGGATGNAASAAVHKVRIAMVRPKGVAADATPYTKAEAAASLQGASDYWSAQTGGKVTFELVPTANTDNWYESQYTCASYNSMWSEAATKTGFGYNNNEHLIVVVPARALSSGACDAYGKGMIGDTVNSYGALYVTALEPSLWAHELGHNMSLGHANALYCSTSSDVNSSTNCGCPSCAGARTVSYGNVWDVMSYSGATVGHGNLNIANQTRLGLLSGGVRTVTASGTYTINALPVATDGNVYGLQVTDPTTNAKYFVELRGDSAGDNRVASDWRNPAKGVMVSRLDSSETNATVVLDGTPTGNSASDFNFAVPVGSTLSSASSKLHFKVLAASGTSATVQLTIGDAVTTPVPDPVVTAPGAPTNVTATSTADNAATVTWTPGSANNGTIDEQTITPYLNGVAQPTRATVVFGSATTATFSGLPAGSYTFRVKAKNQQGYGAESAASPATLVAARPGAVTTLNTSLSGTTVSLSWAPGSDGGAAITSYTVTPRRDSVALRPFTVTGPDATYTLDADADYTFTVTATNSRGTSNPTTSSVVRYNTPVQVTAPGQVAQPTAVVTGSTATGRTATLSWTAPAANNGTINGYQVTTYRDAQLYGASDVSGTSTSFPLTADHQYYFTVAAHNEQGWGQPSAASTTLDLTAAPDAPAAPSLTVQVPSGQATQTATATWTAPATHGAAITGYEVTLLRDSAPESTQQTTSLSLSFPVTAGSTWAVRVRANSAKGYSAASTLSNPITIPPTEVVTPPVTTPPVTTPPVTTPPVTTPPVTTPPVTTTPQTPVVTTPVTPPNPVEEPVATPAPTPVFDATSDEARLGGVDRFDTAALIARQAWTSAETVLVTNGETNGIDALSAAYLAGVKNAPILLTGRDTVPSQTAQTIAALNPREVIVIGGENSVSATAYTELTAGRDGRRIAGVDRYDTAALLLAAGSQAATYKPTSVFLARGDVYGSTVAADALAVSPVAFRAGMPVLLTGRDELPASTLAALRSSGIVSVQVVGSAAAVSADVANTVAQVAGVRTVDRLQGQDRTQTAAEIARFALAADVGFTTDTVGLANGYRIDALAAGPAAGKLGYPLLLTDAPDSLGSGTTDYLTEHSAGLLSANVFGSTSAVSETATQRATKIVRAANVSPR